MRLVVPSLLALLAGTALTPPSAHAQSRMFSDDGWNSEGRRWSAPPPRRKRAKPEVNSEDRRPTARITVYGPGGSRSTTVRSTRLQQQYSADDDEDDRPARKAIAEGPKVLDGGGRPDISPMSPRPVSVSTGQSSGTIVIDTRGRQLLLVTSSDTALRYPISVGRDGFTWTGTERIARVADWPDWHPPEEMRQRDPRLPEKMLGGIRNPLGVKALYLGNSLYRIHGTNDARTIGYAASSGCFRMLNGHVVDLSRRVGVGTKVVVVSHLGAEVATTGAPSSTPGSSKPAKVASR